MECMLQLREMGWNAALKKKRESKPDSILPSHHFPSPFLDRCVRPERQDVWVAVAGQAVLAQRTLLPFFYLTSHSQLNKLFPSFRTTTS